MRFPDSTFDFGTHRQHAKSHAERQLLAGVFLANCLPYMERPHLIEQSVYALCARGRLLCDVAYRLDKIEPSPS